MNELNSGSMKLERSFPVEKLLPSAKTTINLMVESLLAAWIALATLMYMSSVNALDFCGLLWTM